MSSLIASFRARAWNERVKSLLHSVREELLILSFQARARKEAIKLDIHPANLIMRGVKKLYKPERLRRLMPHRARPTPSQDPSFNLSDVELQAWEAHLLPRCDGSKTVSELVKAAGKPENEVLGTLVASPRSGFSSCADRQVWDVSRLDTLARSPYTSAPQ